MALDDFMQTEVAVATAATVAVFSPRVRAMLRRGAVLGLAGAMMAGDALATFTRGVARGAQQTAASTATAVQDAAGAAARAAQGTTNQATAGQEGETRRRVRTAQVTAPDGRGGEA
jgi:uncharacterized protein (DUF1786 family)